MPSDNGSNGNEVVKVEQPKSQGVCVHTPEAWAEIRVQFMAFRNPRVVRISSFPPSEVGERAVSMLRQAVESLEGNGDIAIGKYGTARQQLSGPCHPSGSVLRTKSDPPLDLYVMHRDDSRAAVASLVVDPSAEYPHDVVRQEVANFTTFGVVSNYGNNITEQLQADHIVEMKSKNVADWAKLYKDKHPKVKAMLSFEPHPSKLMGIIGSGPSLHDYKIEDFSRGDLFFLNDSIKLCMTNWPERKILFCVDNQAMHRCINGLKEKIIVFTNGYIEASWADNENIEAVYLFGSQIVPEPIWEHYKDIIDEIGFLNDNSICIYQALQLPVRLGYETCELYATDFCYGERVRAFGRPMDASIYHDDTNSVVVNDIHNKPVLSSYQFTQYANLTGITCAIISSKTNIEFVNKNLGGLVNLDAWKPAKEVQKIQEDMRKKAEKKQQEQKELINAG